MTGEEILTQVRALTTRLYADLPDAPDTCPCGEGDVRSWAIMSPDTVQVCSATHDADHTHGFTGGWDDIDEFQTDFLVCTRCDSAYRRTRIVEWD